MFEYEKKLLLSKLGRKFSVKFVEESHGNVVRLRTNIYNKNGDIVSSGVQSKIDTSKSVSCFLI